MEKRMESVLDKAIEALKSLPEVDRERIAWEIIERVEDKTEWDRIIALPNSQAWLEKRAKAAIKQYEKIEKKLAMTFISLPHENLLRDEPYWQHFDELPEEIKKLAEQNYRLWKENTQHPKLRFKQIHASLPIFSFRVGMRHRSVGTQTPDGKIVWFWVGAFESFEKLVE